MKIQGKKVFSRNMEVIVLPRPDPEPDLVFKAQAVLSMAEFEALYPMPRAPEVLRPSGRTRDVTDPVYKSQLQARNDSRITYIILKSLEATPGLEWEQVKLGDYQTWHLYEKELEESGLSPIEINRITQGCLRANALDDAKIEEARMSFLLREQLESEEQSSLSEGRATTASGEPAKG